MPQEDLINFIKQRLSEGFGKEAIKEALTETDHSLEEIEGAFQFLSVQEEIFKTSPPGPDIPAELPKPRPPEMPKEINSPEITPASPPETPKKEEFLSYQLKEEEISLFNRPKVSTKKKFLLPLIILVALIFVGGVGAFLYDKFVKPDAVSLLPQETAFYFRVKINPEDKQVKNFKELLNKFPMYEKISGQISEEFNKAQKEMLPLKNLDFTISNELILAWITPYESGQEIKEVSAVLIIPDPDLKKLEKLAKDVQGEMEKSKDWKIEKETYKGRLIVKAIPTENSQFKTYPGEPKLEPSSVLTNGHFVFATKSEDIKKIIDTIDDQKITNTFKKDKIKNINSNKAHQKIKKYLPKDYLAIFYSEFDWPKILKTAEETKTVKETEKIFSQLTASLKTALNLPFFKGKKVEEPEKIALALAVIADKNELKAEAFSLDLREDAFQPSQFSFKDSLAGFLAEKIGDKGIIYYSEEKDLKSLFDEIEKTLTKEMTTEEKKEFDQSMKDLELIIGVDIKDDILPLFQNNYAFFIASESTSKESPVISLISEVGDENKTKENLLKLKIPRIPTLEQSSLKTGDAKIMSDMSQIRVYAEIIHSDKKSYKNVSCSYSQIKPICQEINKQIGGWYPIIHQSPDKYCAYTKLTQELDKPTRYYCIDSKGTAEYSDINPGGKNYCTGKTFVCPPPVFGESSTATKSEELVSFSKEIIDGFEIYSMPIYGNSGLNFTIKDKKLILTFTKESLLSILKSLNDNNQKSLKDSQIFAEQFKEAPKNITGISYIYPYGFIGVIKYGANYSINFLLPSLPYFMGISPGNNIPPPEAIIPPIFEFLDRGIAPYLKVLKTVSAYSFSPEKGLNISKMRLVIEELPAEEKKATEDFWNNIGKWFMEKFGPILPIANPGPMDY